MTKGKRTNRQTIIHNILNRKLKNEQYESRVKIKVDKGGPDGYSVSALQIAAVILLVLKTR